MQDKRGAVTKRDAVTKLINTNSDFLARIVMMIPFHRLTFLFLILCCRVGAEGLEP